MWALRRPVRRHCWTNIPCERFIDRAVTSIETGTDTSATSASSGEIQNIIASTATTVSTEVSSWLIVCCRDWLDVVDVVGDPAQQLAARLLVEVAQRQPVDLVLDVGAHPPHRRLHDVVEQVAREPGQQRGRRRRRRARSAARAPTAPKSTPWPGTTSIAATMAATLSSPLAAQLLDRLLLGDAGRAADRR